MFREIHIQIKPRNGKFYGQALEMPGLVVEGETEDDVRQSFLEILKDLNETGRIRQNDPDEKFFLVVDKNNPGPQPCKIGGLTENTSFGALKSKIREEFKISESDGYKYVILWGEISLSGYVDDEKPLGYVREEFNIPWGGTLGLKKVV